ncbi:hypothetical protein [Chryseobacterium gambrini]|uniref:hypothetical protein n=1 Tax=Chryseobacterium gambrini TaxID=373672 RepID=UPI0022F3804E|nr:hypothetical protein [Chryseobacterium gambrini]WBX96037.1 hypothetical protein PE065_14340 [Chryseobacterium gambrini]
MAQFAPHYATYKNINKIKAVSDFLFWFIFGLSISENIFPNLGLKISTEQMKLIIGFSNTVNIISMIVFFFLELLVEVVMIPIADDKRRDDFLDNSIGSRFSLRQSVDYYDNDEVSKGLYKVAVNMFENCYFTHSLVKKLTFKRTVIPFIVMLAILVFAYYGFNQESTIAVILLQLLFSATIFGNLVKHIVLLVKLNQIEKDWTALFNKQNFKTNPEAEASIIYRNWLNYETLHSRIPASIPDKVYNKLNPQLTNDWIALKAQFNIS